MGTRSILRPVLRPVTRAVSDTIRGFNPNSLFVSGEQGIWLDPSDFSTLFQDSAGTTPVTAVGQPVGKILDKSRRGNHATQSTGASRPTLQQDSNGMYYLSFDGTDDGMATPSINFTGTDKMTVWAGFTNLGVGTSELYGLSTNPTSNPAVMLRPTGGGGASGNVGAYSRGSSTFVLAQAVGAGLPPVTLLTTAESSTSDPYLKLRVNGALLEQNTLNQGAGNYGNYPLYIGARAGTSSYFNGRLYSLIVRGAASNAGQIAAGEAWVNGKTRAY